MLVWWTKTKQRKQQHPCRPSHFPPALILTSLGSLSAACHAGQCNDGVSKENLHFDDQSNQAVFIRVFSKRNKKKTCSL